MDTQNGTQNGAVIASRNRIAEAINEKPERIRIVNPEWAKNLRDVVFVAVHVRRTRMKTTLRAEDLGLVTGDPEVDAARRRTVKLGTRYIIPKDECDEADSADHEIRRVHGAYCQPTQYGWALYAGADGSRYQEWKREMEKARDAYLTIGRRIYDSWPELQAQIREDYRVMCQENYARLTSAGLQPPEPVEEWVPITVERMLAGMPTRDQVRDSFRVDWEIKMVPLAAEMASDQAQAQEILVEAAVATEFQRDRLAAMRRENDDFARNFYADLKGNVYRVVYDYVAGVLETMSGGVLDPGEQRRLRNMVEKVENLNADGWLNDVQLEAQMDRVRTIFERQGSTTLPVEGILQRIKGQAFTVLAEIDRLPAERDRVEVDTIGSDLGPSVERDRASVDLDDVVIEVRERGRA